MIVIFSLKSQISRSHTSEIIAARVPTSGPFCKASAQIATIGDLDLAALCTGCYGIMAHYGLMAIELPKLTEISRIPGIAVC